MFRSNSGLIVGAAVGFMILGVAGAMLCNTKAARRRRMMKKAIKTVHNVGTAMQKITAF